MRDTDWKRRIKTVLFAENNCLCRKSQGIKKKVLKLKSRKSRNTWSNKQIWPWSTE